MNHGTSHRRLAFLTQVFLIQPTEIMDGTKGHQEMRQSAFVLFKNFPFFYLQTRVPSITLGFSELNSIHTRGSLAFPVCKWQIWESSASLCHNPITPESVSHKKQSLLKMTIWIRVLTALVEDLVPVTSTNVRWLTMAYNSSSRACGPSSGLYRYQIHNWCKEIHAGTYKYT